MMAILLCQFWQLFLCKSYNLIFVIKLASKTHALRYIVGNFLRVYIILNQYAIIFQLVVIVRRHGYHAEEKGKDHHA